MSGDDGNFRAKIKPYTIITMQSHNFKQNLIWMLCMLGALSPLHAQFAERETYLELGLQACATNYSGDLAEDHISLAQTNMAAALFARLHLSPTFQVRAQVFAGRIGGDDRNFPVLAGRSFKFKTNLQEASVLLETAITTFEYQPVSSDATFHFSPYIFAGFGGVAMQSDVVYYGPESERNRFVVEPLPEGGSNSQFLLITPFGAGLRMIAGNRFSVGLEVCARPVYNDLLDGVSKNGNPKRGDWYHSLSLSFSYFIGKPWQRLD